MYYLYILRNNRNRLYIGQTKNIAQRLKDHGTGHGAKFIKEYGDFDLVYSEEYETRALAMKREKQLKHWTVAKKEALVVGDLVRLKQL